MTRRGLVLVVDDEPMVLEVMARALAGAGYEVYAAANGLKALELFDNDRRVDLVVVNTVMPGMDGPNLVAHLRARQPKLPVIHVTGAADWTTQTAYPDDVPTLVKPFQQSELVRLAHELINRSGDADSTSLCAPSDPIARLL